MIPVLILAAGKSARMQGADKLLQMAHGRPLLRHVTDTALEVATDVHVVLGPGQTARLAALDGLPVTPFVTPDAAEGMSGTLRAGVAQLPDCPAFMLLLADLPDLTAADLRAVLAARAANPDNLIWRGATRAGKPGHPIIFDASLRPDFGQLSGDSGGETLVNPLQGRTHLTVIGDRARRDLDTPADWAAWRLAQQ
ncbi:NTP transferase domain-containing protein [Yoonia sp. R2331]|uniref:nucleotidyltransferase family protein n=1 Tax=Yoonia sp. R2331 TaxID=3237238 RepID=UPI0034E609EA